MSGIFGKEPCSFFEPAAGVEQEVFARDLNTHAEIVLLLQIINYHVGKVMQVDDHFADSKLLEAAKRDLEQRVSGHFHQGFRAIVGERAKAGAEAGREDHRPHRTAFSAALFSAAILSNSRCCTTTSTPLFPRSRFATCSARYTERCCPPVHPNDTIRFLNPRL